MWLPCVRSCFFRHHSRFIMLLWNLLLLSFLPLKLACASFSPGNDLSTAEPVKSPLELSRRLRTDDAEKRALLAFRDTMRNASESLSTWQLATNPCLDNWTGIECVDGSVKSLSLIDLPLLSPMLVPELGDLKELRSLILRGVQLHGNLVSELFQLTSLEQMDLSHNLLTGPISNELSTMRNLKYLNLSSNQLSGPFPVEIARRLKLTSLDLSDNILGGSLPPNMGDMQALTYLNLSLNQLNGSIPVSIANLGNLQYLMLNGNNFVSMPSDLSRMVSLMDLDLSHNKIEGYFPTSLLYLQKLSFVSLFDNLLIGPVKDPDELPASPPQMDFSFNYLQGDLNMLHTLRSAMAYNCMGIGRSSSLVLPYTPGQRNASDCGRFYRDLSACNCSSPLLFSPDGTCNCVFPLKFSLRLTSQKEAMSLVSITFNNNLENVTIQLAEQLLKQQRQIGQQGQIVLDMPKFIPSSASNGTDVLLSGSILPLEGISFSKDEVDAIKKKNGSMLALNVTFFEEQAQLIDIQEVELLDAPPVGAPAAPPAAPPVTPPSPPSKLKRGYGNGVFIALIIIAVALAIVAVVAIWLLLLYCRRRHVYKRDLDSNSIILDSDDEKKSNTGLALRSHRRTVSRARSLKSFGSSPEENPLLDVADSMRRFTYAELEDATAGFDESRRLGTGGFGGVYRGILPDGTIVAVKLLASNSVQGDKEFRNEVQIIGTVHNRHVVSLVGYCIDEEDRILVYEYVPNGSLEDAIFSAKYPVKLGWDQCVVIFEGTARGITYLHEECRFKIIHRDIKPGNVLLDDDFEARVSDFGLARNTIAETSHVTTRVVGTLGYMAPEYSATGQLTEKSDVYSFGVLMLVVLSGRRPTGMDPPGSLCVGLVPSAFMAYYEDRLLSLIGTRFEGQYSRSEAERLLSIALLCAYPDPHVRPTMGQVVTYLTTICEIPRVPKVIPYTVPENVNVAEGPSLLAVIGDNSAASANNDSLGPLNPSAARPSAVSRCQTWSHTIFPDALLVRRSFTRLPSSPPRFQHLEKLE